MAGFSFIFFLLAFIIGINKSLLVSSLINVILLPTKYNVAILINSLSINIFGIVTTIYCNITSLLYFLILNEKKVLEYWDAFKSISLTDVHNQTLVFKVIHCTEKYYHKFMVSCNQILTYINNLYYTETVLDLLNQTLTCLTYIFSELPYTKVVGGLYNEYIKNESKLSEIFETPTDMDRDTVSAKGNFLNMNDLDDMNNINMNNAMDGMNMNPMDILDNMSKMTSFMDKLSKMAETTTATTSNRKERRKLNKVKKRKN